MAESFFQTLPDDYTYSHFCEVDQCQSFIIHEVKDNKDINTWKRKLESKSKESFRVQQTRPPGEAKSKRQHIYELKKVYKCNRKILYDKAQKKPKSESNYTTIKPYE